MHKNPMRYGDYQLNNLCALRVSVVNYSFRAYCREEVTIAL